MTADLWEPDNDESTADARVTLEGCICGECFDCPDGWHYSSDLPCICTPDCALNDESHLRPVENVPDPAGVLS